MTISPRLFNKGQLGMILAGTWYPGAVLNPAGIPNEKIGYFILPSHNPNAGKNVIFEAQPVFVSKNSTDKKTAMKIADWWMSPKGNAVFAKLANTYSGNPKANSDYLPQQKKILLQTIASEHYNVINRFWEATPTPIAEAGVNILAKFILDTDNLDDVLTELEKFAHRYWSKQK